ncbi:hypothetical protein ABK040_008716 [Willaertia magna]
MDKSLQLLHELNQARDTVLPPFHNELLESVVQEINSLSEHILDDIATSQKAQTDEDKEKLRMSSALIYTLYERFKRIVLAYLHTRLERIKTYSTMQLELNKTTQWKDLGKEEQNFANEYRNLIESYGEEIGFDLFKYNEPPKSDFIEVEVVKTKNEKILLETGSIANVQEGARLFLPYVDAERLIQEGYVKAVYE